MYAMILASTQNGGIGKDNTIPWRYPIDMKMFKALTLNQTIIMGKNTWDSLPTKPLPDRFNLVLTNQAQEYRNKYCGPKSFDLDFFDNPNDMFGLTDHYHHDQSARVNWVIGGSSIYQLMFPKCSYVHHTLIHKDYDCDTYFNLPSDELELVSEDVTGSQRELSFRLYWRRESKQPRNQIFEERISKVRRRIIEKSETT